MQNVYYKKISSYSKTREINSATRELLTEIQNKEQIPLFNKQIPLKVHFGEDKCETFIEPKNYVGIIDYLKKNNSKPFYIETNALYRGKRTTKESHLALAKEHGFTQIPIIIADGEMGEDYELIDISESQTKHFTKCKIGREITKNKQLIVLSHFKGHITAGFGGAIKQLSMGCAARGGKLDMHSKSKPIINPLQCKKCFVCTNNCPTNACIINSTIPHIDNKKCVGCATCIAVCPHKAIHINWLSTARNEFLEKLVEYALAAQKGHCRNPL